MGQQRDELGERREAKRAEAARLAERVVFMCLKDGGPLCERGAPLVFEDVEDAHDALRDARDEEGIVAEMDLGMVIRRLKEEGIGRVHYQPSGLRLASSMALEDLARI